MFRKHLPKFQFAKLGGYPKIPIERIISSIEGLLVIYHYRRHEESESNK